MLEKCYKSLSLIFITIIFSLQVFADPLPQNKISLEKIRSESWYAKIVSPYRIRLYYAIFDSPEKQLIEYTLQSQWQNLLPLGQEKLLDLDFCYDLQLAYDLQNISDLQSLPSDFFEKHEQYEIIASLIISEGEQYAQLRYLDLRTGRWSPTIVMQSVNISEIISKSADSFLALLGCEGYIFQSISNNVSERLWTIVFRGSSEDLQTTKAIKSGDCFWVFQQNRRLIDSIITLKEVSFIENFCIATAEYTGNQLIQPGLKVSQIYFTGGMQKFRLVNQEQKSQSGFSIFVSYQEFSTDNKDYLGTTNTTGEFIINDERCRPIFLSIAKTVEGITFAFFRKIIVVQRNAKFNDAICNVNNMEDMEEFETIVVADAEIAEREAQEITPQNIKLKKIQESKRIITIRLEQAKEYLQKKELPSALIAIKSAQQFIRDLGDEESISLNRALKDVEELYEKSIQQKKAVEDFTTACKLLDEVDLAVANLNYDEAQSKLDKIKELWPKEYYEKEFDEVTSRDTRLQALKQQSNTPLGQARQYIVKTALTSTVDQIDHLSLQKLYPHLKILFTQGCMDKSQRYHDLELWLKTRLFLNEISQQLAQKSQEYLNSYKKATSVQQRSDMLDKHQKSYQCSKVIDEWLQQMH